MPKKKKSRKKNQKAPAIVIEPERKEENDGKKEMKETKSEESECSTQATSSAATPKTRFSFSRKKRDELDRSESSGDQVLKTEANAKQTSGNKTVKRSSSLSLDHESKSKIPVPKFRTPQPSKQKHVSASCGNFESKSMVLNPGMDSWRMSGLLQTVEKSNSLCSLNTSALMCEHQGSNTSKMDESLQSTEIPETNVETVTLKSDSLPATPSAGENSCDVTHPVNHDDIIRDAGIDVIQEECDDITDYGEEEKKTSEIAVENDKTSLPIDNSVKQKDCVDEDDTKEHDGPPAPSVTLNASCEEKLDEPLAPVETTSVKTPNPSDELYELDDKNTVIIRQLPDIMLEQHIVLPDEVHCSDWLVLNILHTASAIETC